MALKLVMILEFKNKYFINFKKGKKIKNQLQI
jgi:hypothetical protein